MMSGLGEHDEETELSGDQMRGVTEDDDMEEAAFLRLAAITRERAWERALLTPLHPKGSRELIHNLI